MKITTGVSISGWHWYIDDTFTSSDKLVYQYKAQACLYWTSWISANKIAHQNDIIANTDDSKRHFVWEFIYLFYFFWVCNFGSIDHGINWTNSIIDIINSDEFYELCEVVIAHINKSLAGVRLQHLSAFSLLIDLPPDFYLQTDCLC